MLTKFILLAVLVVAAVTIADVVQPWRGMMTKFARKNCNEAINEIFTRKGGCESTCQTGPERQCGYQDNRVWPACECKPGYLRNAEGVCVAESSCPQQAVVNCDKEKYETLTISNSGCEPTCEVPWPVCHNLQSRISVCNCISGYVRNSSVQCIKINDCRDGDGLPYVQIQDKKYYTSNDLPQ